MSGLPCGTGENNTAKEGKADICLPEGVFYNRVQQFNRDLSVAIIRHFQLIHYYEWLQRVQKKIQGGNSEVSRQYEGINILEALSATGIRSIRFALEISNVRKIIANDLDPNAVNLIKQNVSRNGVEKHVEVACEDAIHLMHMHRAYEKRFTVVDIDPYGTASPFLDCAIQCLHDGGLLCVTSTDMAVLCGSTPGTSMGKYGGLAVKNGATLETGLRILLHAIQSAASRHSRVIEPLLSLSIDFYARVFVRVWSSPGAVKAIAAKHAICFTCSGCGAYHIQPLGLAVSGPKRLVPAHGPPVGPSCAECGSSFHVFGPIWNGPLHSRSFLHSFLNSLGCESVSLAPTELPVVQKENTVGMVEHSDGLDPTQRSYPLETELKCPLPEGFSISSDLTQPQLPTEMSQVLGTFRRIVGMSTMAFEELPDVALYYKTDHLTAVLGTLIPPLLELHSALLNAGYRVSSSHAEMNVFKTDAPISFIWDVLLAYKRRLLETETTKPTHESSMSSADDDAELEKGDDVSVGVPESKRQRKRRIRHSKAVKKQSDEGQPEAEDSIDNRRRVRATLLSRPTNPHVDFTIHPNANPPSRVAGLVRYQPKPEKFWGPKARPKISKVENMSS